MIKIINIFKDIIFFIQILQTSFIVMEQIVKCECPPGSESYEDEDGMLICASCKGWIQA